MSCDWQCVWIDLLTPFSCCRDRPCCEFRGLLLSQSQRCSSFVSPCGGLVFAGGKGQIHVWNSDTGEYVIQLPDGKLETSLVNFLM